MDGSSSGFGLIFVAMILSAVGMLWWKVTQDKPQGDWDSLVVTHPGARDLEAELIKLSTLIAAEHAHALYVKSKQLIAHDAYGRQDASRYYQEILYFIRHVVMEDQRFIDLAKSWPTFADPFVSSACGIGQGTLQKKMGNEIIDFIDSYETLTGMIQSDWEAATPLEFEALCAQKMETAGWNAQLTKGSGDQGADVICRKDGVSLVLQCKFYSSPIGNKAVQEAFAARSFYDLDHAAVVTNQSYTKSAAELANMTGVLLLHLHDLNRVNELLAARGIA